MTGKRAAVLKRRGLIAGAAALVAGLAAERASAPVAAQTTDTNFVANGNTDAGFETTGTFLIGVYGKGSSYGVRGDGGAFGVFGNSSSGHGVYGNTDAAGGGLAGVYGYGNGSGTYGVYGNNPGGIGVGATASGSSNAAVLGVGQGGAIGVQGQAHGIGVYGLSDTSYGVLGVTTAGGVYSGVTGSITTATGAAFAGGASQASAYAAYFTGKVNIDGPFLVNGTQRFTLKHADGSARLVSGALSVEPVVEDFGTGTLSGGRAAVTLDADFRDVADIATYHVFLTMYDAAQTLFVADRTAAGFTVRAQDASASGPFSYRIVAKPKDGGGKIARMAKYEQPQIRIPGINGVAMPPEVNAPIPPTPEKPQEPPVPPPRAAPATTAAPAPAAQPTTAPGARAAPAMPAPAPPPR